MTTTQPTTAQIQVWWIPQIPLRGDEPFTVEVPDLDTGKLLIDTLAQYDLYQLKHKIKPDYSNAGGVRYRLPGQEDWEEIDIDDRYDVVTAENALADAGHGLPWAIDHDPGNLQPGDLVTLVGRVQTQRYAELLIAGIETIDPEGVYEGKYGIVGPPED